MVMMMMIMIMICWTWMPLLSTFCRILTITSTAALSGMTATCSLVSVFYSLIMFCSFCWLEIFLPVSVINKQPSVSFLPIVCLSQLSLLPTAGWKMSSILLAMGWRLSMLIWVVVCLLVALHV